MTTKREKLIINCRYYKGEDNCPYNFDPDADNTIRWYWDMERLYVRNGGKLDDEMSEYYEKIGGKKYNDIPHSLLITMFTSWGKWSYDLKAELPYFYKVVEDYLSSSSGAVE